MDRERIVAEFLDGMKGELKRFLDKVEEDLVVKGRLTFWEYEMALRDLGHTSKQRLLETVIKENGNGYQGWQLRCPCGERLEYQGERPLKVVTLIGEINIKRAYYAQGLCGHGLVPLDETLGIVKGWSSKMQELLSLLGGEISFERAAELLYEVSGLVVSKDSLGRMTEEIGAELEHEQRRRESRAELDSLGHFNKPIERLYLAVDGLKVPLNEGWRELKLGAIFKGEREGKETEVSEVSYFGGIVNTEEFGRRWKSQGLRRGSKSAKEAVIIGDGSDWIWNKATELFPDSKQIVDWYHAKEYLYNLANKVYGEGSEEAKKWAKGLEGFLWEGDINRVLKEIERVRLKDKEKEKKQLINNALLYYGNNAHRMKYQEFREGGYLIGSGVIEGACKSVVGQRLKISGARWHKENAEKILHLRIYRRSGWWEDFWKRRRKVA